MTNSWPGLFSGLSRDIGIDLGTANTLVHVSGRGIVLSEPSVIAISRDDGRVLKYGLFAKEMIGRTPLNIEAIRPIKGGVIADYVHTEELLKHFISQVSNRFLLRKCVVIGVPSGATDVERRAVLEASRSAGATQTYLIDEPLAAAIGAGLPITGPSGSIIVDIGGGTTDVAIVSLSGIVHSHSIRIAGDELDEAIISHMRRAHNLFIGECSAEQAKINIGSAVPLEQEIRMELRGRDLITGLPRSMIVTSDEIRGAMSESLNAIVEAVRTTLEAAPPEIAADAMERGITVAGGGALLRGMDRLLEQHTSLKVRIAKDPLNCVVLGAGYAVNKMRHDRSVRRMLERASLS